MSRTLFEFSDPDRFVIGTIGAPGEREFFLQISLGPQVMSFAMEKGQAAALAERATELLKEIGKSSIPYELDTAPLSTPVESEFAIGVMSLTWSPKDEKIVFEAQSMADTSGEVVYEELISDLDPQAPPLLRVQLTSALLRAFVKRTSQVVSAGRQPCVFCGGPINQDGHLCPRANGYRRT